MIIVNNHAQEATPLSTQKMAKVLIDQKRNNNSNLNLKAENKDKLRVRKWVNNQ